MSLHFNKGPASVVFEFELDNPPSNRLLLLELLMLPLLLLAVEFCPAIFDVTLEEASITAIAVAALATLDMLLNTNPESGSLITRYHK